MYIKMVEEAQAACEGYSLYYVEAERIWELLKYDAATAKTSKKIQATNGQCERQLKRDLRGEEDEDQQNLMEAELELLAEESSQLILEYEKAKGELRERRRMFGEEAAITENSKVDRQTARAGMEGVMKDNRIKFGAFRAGDIHGNGCRKLMSCGGEITKYMTELLQIMPAGKKNFSDEEIG